MKDYIIVSGIRLKVPTEEEINKYAEGYDNCFSSMAEAAWMPQGFKKGVEWVIKRMEEINGENTSLDQAIEIALDEQNDELGEYEGIE